MYRFITLLLLSFLVVQLNAQNFSNGFPFTLPAFDSTTQVFLPHFEKKEITTFITTDGAGQFMLGADPIRFWGVNLTTGACFPQQADASGIASRMRKMGINLVRFHHMDNPWTSSEGSIFLQNGSTTSLNPVTLDRLHYFLATLKKEGVYANINLHVSRTFTEADGVMYADSILEFGKVVNYFDEQIIQLQKQYARQLLTTVNPYTGLSIADDPVMAMLEITNENTLYGFWKDGRLHGFSENGGILSRHSDTLDLKWNLFLMEKYGTQNNLQAAWQNGGGADPVEIISDGDFESGNLDNQWTLEVQGGAQASAMVSTTTPYEGNYCAQVQVTQVTGTNWHIQFEQNGRSIEEDSVYTVHFFAKAAMPTEIFASSIRNAPPWTWYGGTSINLTTDWQEFTFSFTAPESNDSLTRISFNLGGQPGTYWFDKVSMKLSQKTGLEPGEDLSLGNIRRIRYYERLGFNPKRVADMAEFYLKLQRDYYDEMSRFLRDEVGVKVPITGSNALGGPYEPFTHESLDYIDDHAYWDHPNFPNVPWSSWDWNINNNSMLGTDFLGYVPQIFGGYQVHDKPFTISELNHPYPNIYQAEMVPILAAYGAFHGADGFMFFEYNGGDPADWETDIQRNFFGLHRNTPVMALFPLFSYAYRNGMVQEDADPILVDYTNDYIYNLPQHDDGYRWWKYFPYDEHLALTSGIQITGFDHSVENIPEQVQGDPPFVTTTQEIIYSPQQQLLNIRTPQLECVAGQLENAAQLSGNQMQVLEGNEHGVIAWMSLTDESLAASARSLIAVTSRIQNQNMMWDGTTTVHNNWGDPPTEVQALNIKLLINLAADSIRIYPLNPIGEEGESFVVLPQSEGQFVVDLDQNEWQSLWFGVEALGIIDGVSEVTPEKSVFIYPNPVSGNENINIRGLSQSVKYQLINPQGKLVQEGFCESNIALNKLPPGMYYLVIKTAEDRVVQKLMVW